MNIHDFISERIGEDAALAQASIYEREPDEPWGYADLRGDGPHIANWSPWRVLQECRIKRQIVEAHAGGSCSDCLGDPGNGCLTIRLLSQAWSGHQLYDRAWDVLSDGGSSMSPATAAAVIAELTRPGVHFPCRLTEREAEAIALIADGLYYRDIGKRLFISENTVKNHAQNGLKKLRLYRRDPPWWPGPA
jgi:hypothetical protein